MDNRNKVDPTAQTQAQAKDKISEEIEIQISKVKNLIETLDSYSEEDKKKLKEPLTSIIKVLVAEKNLLYFIDEFKPSIYKRIESLNTQSVEILFCEFTGNQELYKDVIKFWEREEPKRFLSFVNYNNKKNRVEV